MRSESWQPPAPEQRDELGASSCQQSTGKKQRGDVKGAEASARTSEHDRASGDKLIFCSTHFREEGILCDNLS